MKVELANRLHKGYLGPVIKKSSITAFQNMPFPLPLPVAVPLPITTLKFSGYFGWLGADKNTVFRNAAAEGNLDVVKELFTQGADINSTNTWGSEKMTALALAVRYKRVAVAEYLLENGANPNIGNVPPLELAIENNLNKLSLLLLEKEACPNFSKEQIWMAQDKPRVYWTSYLTEAIRRNQLDVVTALLKKKAMMSSHQTEYTFLARNALTVAVDMGNLKAVEILISHGAQIHEKNCFVCLCKKCKEAETTVKLAQGESALEAAERLSQKEPDNADRKQILELLKNPELILKHDTVLENPAENLLLDCLEKVSTLSSSIALRENLALFSESNVIEYVGESLKRKIRGSQDDATILKNKLCILYSKEDVSVAKDVWDRIAIKAFGAPIIVLAGIGGLNKILGMEEIKDEIVQQIIRPLIHAKTDCFSGLILTGPPGTGKTFLAYQIAEHLGYPMHVVNSSDLLTNIDGEAFYGEAAKRIDSLFTNAIKNAPSILFFDEIDSIARRRSKTNSNSASIDTNQIIQNINALINHNAKNPTKRVLMIGAANFLSHLDPALIRPGRVLHIDVPTCDESSKVKILQAQLSETNLDIDHDYSKIVKEIARDEINLPPSDLIDIFKRARNMVDNEQVVTEGHIRKAWGSVRKVRANVNRQVVEGES